MKRLFLLDAYALIFRAYYALIKMPRITQSGFNTSAIFGFVNTLEEVLERRNLRISRYASTQPVPHSVTRRSNNTKGEKSFNTGRHQAFCAYYQRDSKSIQHSGGGSGRV